MKTTNAMINRISDKLMRALSRGLTTASKQEKLDGSSGRNRDIMNLAGAAAPLGVAFGVGATIRRATHETLAVCSRIDPGPRGDALDGYGGPESTPIPPRTH